MYLLIVGKHPDSLPPPFIFLDAPFRCLDLTMKACRVPKGL